MSHLACHEHGKRVSFTTAPTVVTHRSDLSVCDSRIFRTGTIKMDRVELRQYAEHDYRILTRRGGWGE
jgi:hypothetical protein